MQCNTKLCHICKQKWSGVQSQLYHYSITSVWVERLSDNSTHSEAKSDLISLVVKQTALTSNLISHRIPVLFKRLISLFLSALRNGKSTQDCKAMIHWDDKCHKRSQLISIKALSIPIVLHCRPGLPYRSNTRPLNRIIMQKHTLWGNGYNVSQQYK